MAFVVETGTGSSTATSYASVSFADAYFTSLGRLAEWHKPGCAEVSIPWVDNPTAPFVLTVGTSVELTIVTGPVSSGKQVLRGATPAATLANVVAAWHDRGGRNQLYSNDLAGGQAVYDLFDDGAALRVRARAPGSTTEVVLMGAVGWPLQGGSRTPHEAALNQATSYMEQAYALRWQGERASTAQALSWPRRDAEDLLGDDILPTTIPVAVQQACCELALVALTQPLTLATLPTDSAPVQSESISVGPLSISTSFGGGGRSATHVQVPQALDLLRAAGLLGGSGEVVRG